MTPLQRLAGRKALVINRAVPAIDSVERIEDGTFFYRSAGSTLTSAEEEDCSFQAFATGLYKSSPPVFTCSMARMLPFSEVRFQFQEMRGGRPGRMFGNEQLKLLENPWTNATTGELLARMEQDASLAGNFYATTVGEGADRRIRRLRPDYVRIISGVRNSVADPQPWAIEAEVIGYVYHVPDRTPVLLTPDRVVHYSPIPDPEAQWRGMSWLTPLVREVRADEYATTHKLNYYEKGAQLGTVISYDSTITPAAFQQYVALFEDAHRGADNAYKTLHIGGGADATVVGTELKTDFRAIQGAGETRIAAAAGVGAIIARFSEGLAGSSLNQGNYNAAKRQFADMTLRPLWRQAASSLAKLVTVPSGSRLTYDTRDVEFLKDDRSEAADTLERTARTMRSLVDAGYTPDSVVEAVETGDLSRLLHSGLYSVQLQRPGADTAPVA